MMWVVIAIVIYIAAYTIINVGFRKPEGGHEPWAEAQERREEVQQEAMLDWIRFHTTLLPAAAPTQPLASARIERGPETGNLERALPIELVLIIPARPELARAPAHVSSPAALAASEAFAVSLEFDSAATSQMLGDFLAYAKDQHLRLFLQDDSRLSHDTQPVAANGQVALMLPAGGLAAGQWKATLYCVDATFTWDFVVE